MGKRSHRTWTFREFYFDGQDTVGTLAKQAGVDATLRELVRRARALYATLVQALRDTEPQSSERLFGVRETIDGWISELEAMVNASPANDSTAQ